VINCEPCWRKSLTDELASWRGTPWAVGGQAKGVGADCVGFITGVLVNLGHLPQGSRVSFSDSEDRVNYQFGRLRELTRLWRGESVDTYPAAGDIVVARTPSGTGHVLIVGGCGIRWWNSTNAIGVQFVTAQSVEGSQSTVAHVIRVEGREKWKRQ